MRIDLGGRWSWIALAAAALFALISVVAVFAVTAGQRESARQAGEQSSALQERYRVAAAAIQAYEAERIDAECALERRIVGAVQLQDRMQAALEESIEVYDAYLTLPFAARIAFENARLESLAALDGVSLTEADRALAETHAESADVFASCVASATSDIPPLTASATAAEVEEVEARVASLPSLPSIDATRLDALDAAIVELAPVLLDTADARVAVTGLEESEGVLRAAADALRQNEGAGQTLLALESILADSRAAIELQALNEAAAEQAAPEAAGPAAPQPAEPATVDPQPQPEPEPEPTTDPEPTTPDDGGDSPVDPLVP